MEAHQFLSACQQHLVLVSSDEEFLSKDFYCWENSSSVKVMKQMTENVGFNILYDDGSSADLVSSFWNMAARTGLPPCRMRVWPFIFSP